MAIEYEQISSDSTSERASIVHEPSIEKTPRDAEGSSVIILPSDGAAIVESDVEHNSVNLAMSYLPAVHAEKDSAQGEAGDIELGGFFLEDVPSNEILPPDILKAQRLEKIKSLSEKKNLDKLDGIWKKASLLATLISTLCR